MKKFFSVFVMLLMYHSLYSQVPDSSQAPVDTVIATPPPPAKPEEPARTRRDTRPLKDRIDFGFGSSFWITPSETFVEIAPVLAYRFPKRLITGVGYRYIYRHHRVYNQDLNAYGPNFFARLDLLKRVYLWTEYEILHNEYISQVIAQEVSKGTTTTDSWFAGLGYIRSVGKRGRGGISVQVLYNFLYERDAYSPYWSAFTYRVGYFF